MEEGTASLEFSSLIIHQPFFSFFFNLFFKYLNIPPLTILQFLYQNIYSFLFSINYAKLFIVCSIVKMPFGFGRLSKERWYLNSIPKIFQGFGLKSKTILMTKKRVWSLIPTHKKKKKSKTPSNISINSLSKKINSNNCRFKTFP